MFALGFNILFKIFYSPISIFFVPIGWSVEIKQNVIKRVAKKLGLLKNLEKVETWTKINKKP